MARGWIHTLHRDGEWLNEREAVEHLIHDRDGKISARNSYGRDDPRKPR
jgi:hypothetical protein